jgi:sugar lactone lactonase YvrE
MLSGQSTSIAASDVSTLKPFGSLVIADDFSTDVVSATVAFTASNGTLSGIGLSAGSISNGVIAYTLSATSAAALQQELNSIVFSPTPHQVSAGSSVQTSFTLSVTGGGAGAGTSPLFTLTSTQGGALNVATDASGNVIVQEYNAISEYSSTGALLRTISTGFSSSTGNALAIDAKGDVFVANSGNGAVNEYSSTGALLRTISSGVPGIINIATDASGDLFVSNSGTYPSKVVEYSASGTLKNTLTGVSSASAIATDSKGDIFVADSAKNAVLEFSSSGTLLRTITDSISGPGSLATDASGNVYVTNNFNNTVTKYSATGVKIETLSVNSALSHSLATDKNGNVYVANNSYGSTSNVQEFSASGKLLRTLTTGMSSPAALATDAVGNVYVANSSGAVEKFSAAPPALTVTNSTTKVTATAAATSAPSIKIGNSQIVDAGNHSIISGLSITDAYAGSSNVHVTISDHSGLLNVAAIKGLTISGAQTNNLQLTGSLATINAAISTLIDTNSVVGSDSLSISYTDPTGPGTTSTHASATKVVTVQKPITFSGLTTQGTLVDTASANPFGHVVIHDTIAHDSVSATISFNADNGVLSGNGLSYGTYNSNGNVSYTLSATSAANLQSELNGLSFTPTQVSAGHTVSTKFSLTLNGGDGPSSAISTGLYGLNSLAINSHGDVYVASGSAVKEYAPDGTLISTLTNGVAGATGIAADTKGDLFVLNSNNSVAEYSAGGALLRVLHTGITNPTSLTTDPNGNVFVANAGAAYGSGATIQEFSSSGKLVATISSGLTSVTSMTTDKLGDLFVAGSGYTLGSAQHSLEEYSASGALLKTMMPGYDVVKSVVTDASGNVYVADSTKSNVQEFSADGTPVRTLSAGLSSPTSLAVDANGNVYVGSGAFNGSSVVEFSADGTQLRTITNGVNGPAALATDSSGSVYVANANTTYTSSLTPDANLLRFSADATTVTVTDSSTALSASPTQHFDASAKGTLASPLKLTGVLQGDTIAFNDATSLHATAITSANMIAAGGKAGSTSLSDWVAGALSAKAGAAHLGQHAIGWFDLNGSTYLVEQAHSAGSAFGNGDALVQLVGVNYNESAAHFSGHVVTL